MSAVVLLLIAAGVFIFAYFTYGKYLDKKLGIDPNRKTPAVEMADGVDYVATNRPVLLGHHFATIAGGGPIVGPISAAVLVGSPLYYGLFLEVYSLVAFMIILLYKHPFATKHNQLGQ